MASKQASSRLRKELKAISADPPPHIYVSVDESNILHWNYLLQGPSETPYDGGWYWGRLKFPKDYPVRPPSILMVTPNGRFETNTRLCLSMSDYHPETWSPAWSVATVLKGLLSFMCEESPTAGAIDPPPPVEERRRLAASSLQWNKAQAEFAQAFPEVERIVAEAEAQKPPAQAPAPAAEERSAGQPEAAGGEPPAARGEEAPSPQLRAGDTVRLQGLKARTDLNGKRGVVQPSGDRADGRICVCVQGEVVGVKPENVERIEGPDEARGGEAKVAL